MAIRDLPQRTVALTSQLPFGDTTNSCDGRASVSDLLALAAGASSDLTTQYLAPSLTGFIAVVSPPLTGGDVWLQLRPTATFAGGNVTLPAPVNSVDGQKVLVTTTQTITALTVSGNGATVNGAPTTLAAGGYFELRFDGIFGDWNRVG